MPSLVEARFEFSRGVGMFLPEVNALGMHWVLDETKRSPETARWNATHCRVVVGGKRCEQLDISHEASHQFKPIGSKKSTHIYGLALDLLLFNSDRDIVEDRGPYEKLGRIWVGLNPNFRWGGNFQGFPDLGHFSREWEGVQ